MEALVSFPDVVKHEGDLLAVEFGNCCSFRRLYDQEREKLTGHETLLPSILFPTKEIATCECTPSELLQVVKEFLERIVRLSEADCTAMAAFIVSTFFTDVLPLVPSMALISRVPEQAIAAFTAISSVCRNAIVIADSVPLERLPLFLNPLLAIDATAMPPSRLDRVVPLGSPIVKRVVGSRVESVIAARLILSREPVRNASLNVALRPSLSSTLWDAQSLVDRLAGYRLRRHKEVAQNAQGCWRPVDIFAACFRNDDCTREKVATSVSAVQRQLRLSAIDECSEENFLTQALHAAIHKQDCVKILELANLAMDLSEREGLRCPVSPKFVAAFMRRNGLRPRHARVGLVLEVNARSAWIVHQLCAEAFGADRLTFRDCALCADGISQVPIQ
jgi:hypothetical protein